MTSSTPAPDSRAVLLGSVTEREWLDQVCMWARRAGYLVYHTYDSRRSTGGFPDLVMSKPGHPVIFAELKTVKGRITPQQKAWLDDLAMSSSEVLARVWRPTDEDDVKRVLGLR